MQKNSFEKRFLIPVAILLAVMTGSRIVYFNASLIDNDTLYQYVAIVSGLIHFFSIGFGTLFIYPKAYFNGAGRMERMIACLITPLVWNFFEIFKMSKVFPFLESLYYGLNSLAILTFTMTFALMGICEMVCRYLVKKRGGEVKIITPAPIISIVTLFIIIYITAIWGNGAHWFYIFMNGYISLFVS
jgi:hypothetical protein